MKRNIVIAALTATAVIGGGATLAFAGSGDGSSPAPSTTTSPASSVTLPAEDDDDRDDDGTEAKVTAAQAIEAALKERPGTAVSADLDHEDDDDGPAGLHWEVDVLGKGDTSYTVYVDPSSGQILDSRSGVDDDDDAEERKAAQDAGVTAAEAATAAAAKGFVTSIDLDDDDRTVAWDVEVSDPKGTESDWTVNPKSGTVTADRADEDASDRADDDGSDQADDDSADDSSDDASDDHGDDD
ncbi:PepSY domain-containing protein [Streptomyces sp. NPDC056716]|uniref:PepSY domain-containing protein n=1 Tax=unclassified Streptomyces TaxID=2593676 RepID=UPI003690E9EE